MRRLVNCFKNLAKERNDLAIRFSRGRLLDIGCGKENYIEKNRQDCLGVDLWDVKGDGSLPFDDKSFDSVSMVASFNYLTPDQQFKYLESIHRVLKIRGLLIITCITPLGGLLKKLFFKDGERKFGMDRFEILSIVIPHGFKKTFSMSFNYGLNNIFIFERIP